MLALIAAAHAATSVVAVGGSPDDALAEVALRTGIPREDLAALTLGAQLTPGVRGGTAIPCAGPPVDRAGLQAALAAVVARYDAGNLADAREAADALDRSTACLTEPLDSSWAWSAAFVSGVVAFAAGSVDEARFDWVRARSLDPQRPWDDDFAPGDALASFATALPGPGAPFRSVGGAFLVDGAPAGATIAPGRRVLQAGDPLQTWVVDLDQAALAVAPNADPVALAADPEALAAVLTAALPGERAVYVVDGADVVRMELPSGSMRPILAPPPPERHPRWGPVALGVGAGLVAGGLVDVGWNAAAAGDANAAGRLAAGDLAAWQAARSDWRAAAGWWYAGWGAVGVGGVVLGAGAVDSALLARGEPR